MEEKTRSVGKIIGGVFLALFNVAMIVAAVLVTVIYSDNTREQQKKKSLESFCNSVETLKQLSEQYLDNEYETAVSWKAYIEDKKLSLNEAIEYISSIDSNTASFAHFVETETFHAWTTKPVGDSNVENRYYNDSLLTNEHDKTNNEIIRRIAAGEKRILGRYRVVTASANVISVGVPVSLYGEGETEKEYVLLRIIPIEVIRKIWIFPTTFQTGQIGLIGANGDYIVAAPVMKNANFVEFARSYTYPNDYYGADRFMEEVQGNDSGLTILKTSDGSDGYWYYSKLNHYLDADIIGYVSAAEMSASVENLSIVVVVAGLVLLLALVDAIYILSLNKKYKEMARVADKANLSKTQFLSTMSHDIRTPLNAVIGMTELAQGKIDDKEYVKECLRKISVSGNHLLTLINDILEISRVESGKIVVNPAPFDVTEMVSSLESITRSQATGHGQKLTVNAENLPHKYLVGDKLRLTQVYLNLLNNAVKYTRSGGEIYFEAKEEDLGNGKVVLSCTIKDNGIGMTEEFQKCMYNSFTRVADSRVDKIQGTGLGLSIVKKMVELMDGEINCESKVDEGTTFVVNIPLEISDDISEEKDVEKGLKDDNSDLCGINVLIAEDNDINWEIISTILDSYGMICRRAENGKECVDILNAEMKGTFDIVLMDVQMPVMNGLEATRRLRSSERTDLQMIPIIAMTADAFAEDIQNCIDAGMNAHVAKPIETDKVLSAIRRFLSRNR